MQMMTSDREREDAASRLRAGLPPPLQETFDQLWSKEALGSRVRLRATATFLTQFAAQVHAASGAALLDLLHRVRQLLTSDWPYQAALLNGTARLLAMSIPAQGEPDIALVRMVLAQRCSHLLESSDQAIQRIVTFLANVLAGANAVLVHDYSSTVLAALQHCAERGQKLRIYATACHSARSDGKRVAREATSYGHQSWVVDDLAAGTILARGEVDAFLVGADAVLAGGELINTTGTLPLCITARHFRIPVYCPTELMKLSIPSVYGQPLPALPVENSQETYTLLFDITPAECLRAYVTEIGLVPPVAFPAAARQYALVAELL
jgi:methylthioribose-1-phosphate isomerase